jgi:hypothetical protein
MQNFRATYHALVERHGCVPRPLPGSSVLRTKTGRPGGPSGSFDYLDGSVTLYGDTADLLAAYTPTGEPPRPGTPAGAHHTMVHETLHGCGPRLSHGIATRDSVPPCLWPTLTWDDVRGRGWDVLSMFDELVTELAAREILRREHGHALDYGGQHYYGQLLERAVIVVSEIARAPAAWAWERTVTAALAHKSRSGEASYLDALWDFSVDVIGANAADLVRALLPVVRGNAIR